jgi:signal transduction histidine kinase
VRRAANAGIAAAGAALSVVAYRIQVEELASPPTRAVTIVAVAWSFLLAGLIAWTRRPANRLGPLMALAGFALLLRQLRYSHDAALFTTFFALGDLPYALVGHAVLVYPFGRVTDRLEKALVKLGYVTVLAFPLAVLLFYSHDPQRQLLGFNPRDLQPRESLLTVYPSADAVELLQKGFVVAFYGVISALFIAVIIRRFVRATPRARRLYAPLLLAAVALALRAVSESVFVFVDRPFSYHYLFWWQVAGFIALPLALVAGLVRARLARAGVGDLVIELERTKAEGLRDALSRALGDPTLELAFWLPERRAYVDAGGRAVELPAGDDARAATKLEHDGEPVAALVHDPSLLDEPQLVQAAGAAARLAIENARLEAELRAQLDEVRASRKRIVAAGDAERRRVERDLHDGAQQRLVALALQLRTAQRRLDRAADPEVERLLDAAVDELQSAVDELRELARGVHPAILTEDGLAAALESLAGRSPVPVRLAAAPEERFPAEVEATAYFVACEALANVAKHARASAATVAAGRVDGLLVVEVTDDGVGGALPSEGSGLHGLADRVEALGGRLRVESREGEGTRVVGEIPCAS